MYFYIIYIYIFLVDQHLASDFKKKCKSTVRTEKTYIAKRNGWELTEQGGGEHTAKGLDQVIIIINSKEIELPPNGNTFQVNFHEEPIAITPLVSNSAPTNPNPKHYFLK